MIRVGHPSLADNGDSGAVRVWNQHAIEALMKLYPDALRAPAIAHPMARARVAASVRA
jgi:hypothetical protein